MENGLLLVCVIPLAAWLALMVCACFGFVLSRRHSEREEREQIRQFYEQGIPYRVTERGKRVIKVTQ